MPIPFLILYLFYALFFQHASGSHKTDLMTIAVLNPKASRLEESPVTEVFVSSQPVRKDQPWSMVFVSNQRRERGKDQVMGNWILVDLAESSRGRKEPSGGVEV